MTLRILLLAATLMTATGASAQSLPDTAPAQQSQSAREQQASSPVQGTKAPPARPSRHNKAAAKPKKGVPTSEPTRPAKPSIPVAPPAR